MLRSLDGVLGADLLSYVRTGRSSPSSLAAHWRAKSTTYVFLPEWVTKAPAGHPLFGKQGIESLLGSRDFPLAAAFPSLVAGVSVSRIYATDAGRPVPVLGLWDELQTPRSLAEAERRLVVEKKSEYGRAFCYFPHSGVYKVQIDVGQTGPFRLDVNALKSDSTWAPVTSLGADHGSGASSYEFYYVPSGREEVWGLYSTEGLTISDARITLVGSEIPAQGEHSSSPARLVFGLGSLSSDVRLDSASTLRAMVPAWTGMSVLRFVGTARGNVDISRFHPTTRAQEHLASVIPRIGAFVRQDVQVPVSGMYDIRAPIGTSFTLSLEPASVVDFSATDGGSILGTGWWGREDDDIGAFRWTKSAGEFRLSVPSGADLVGFVELRVPEELFGVAPVELSLSRNTERMVSAVVPSPGEYVLQVPLRGSEAGEEATFVGTIGVSRSFSPDQHRGISLRPGDRRELGVRVRRLGIRPSVPSEVVVALLPVRSQEEGSAYTSSGMIPTLVGGRSAWIVPSGSVAPRIRLQPVLEYPAAVEIEYFDGRPSRVDVNFLVSEESWAYVSGGIVTGGSGGWRKAFVALPESVPRSGPVVVGLYVQGADLVVAGVSATWPSPSALVARPTMFETSPAPTASPSVVAAAADAIVATEALNLRTGPGTSYPAIGLLRRGQVLRVVGRDVAGDWLYLGSGTGPWGWAAATGVVVTGGTTGIPVVTPATASTTPVTLR